MYETSLTLFLPPPPLPPRFRCVRDVSCFLPPSPTVCSQSPAFGEDDYRVCLAHGVIVKGEEIPCPVDSNGLFTAEVGDYAGKYVKDADKALCDDIKARGRLVSKDNYTHRWVVVGGSRCSPCVPAFCYHVPFSRSALIVCFLQGKGG